MLTFTKLVIASAFLLSIGTQAAPVEKRATVNPPKVGYELENRKISLKIQNPGVTATSHDASALKEAIKGMPVSITGITQNPRWALTAETEGTGLTTLTPEIIVDGGSATQRRGVPLIDGENVGEVTGKEITDFVNQWVAAWPNVDGRLVTIEDTSVRPALSAADVAELRGMTWSAEAEVIDPASLEWGLQATAPFPLEALKDLLPSYDDDARSFSQKSPLVQNGKLSIIERCYIPFKSNKKKVDWKVDGAVGAMDAWTERDIDDEVLGYLSLVLGYIRGTKSSDASKGLKHSTSVMPRTDFKSMYRELGIKAKVHDIVDKIVDSTGGSIPHWHDTAVQSSYPRTKLDKKEPLKTLVYAICRLTRVCDTGDDFDTLRLKWKGDNGATVGPMVSKWLEDIDDAGTGIDLVSQQDQQRHGQIGGLKDTFETVIGGNKKLPIFEFRDLMAARTNDISKKLGEIETEIRKHHTAARSLRKRATPKKAIKKNKYCYKVRAKPTSTSTSATATPTSMSTSATATPASTSTSATDTPASTSTSATATATQTKNTATPTQTSSADRRKELEEKLAAKKAEKERVEEEMRKKQDNNGGSGNDKDKDSKCKKLKGLAKIACMAADTAVDAVGI